eukprot:TRINITY_DN45771_c0_g1_i1.p1 TRINITY_DN45771_c0_g1~~TRINITY_DN45771_c0_g1_i1.p1  ORF type:complete len:176 (+),score=9.31 TRINITY_DN45771_c0_g1_i1:158-685(+)
MPSANTTQRPDNGTRLSARRALFCFDGQGFFDHCLATICMESFCVPGVSSESILSPSATFPLMRHVRGSSAERGSLIVVWFWPSRKDRRRQASIEPESHCKCGSSQLQDVAAPLLACKCTNCRCCFDGQASDDACSAAVVNLSVRTSCVVAHILQEAICALSATLHARLPRARPK